MMKLTKAKSDSGFTLVELLIGIAITALIAISVVRIGMDSSKGLTRSVSELRITSQVTNLTRNLRYDISGSSDLYVFTSTEPPASMRNVLCTTWNSTTSTWLNSASDNFVRTLISVPVNDLDYVASEPVDGSSVVGYLPVIRRWFGYELRRTAGNYSIWRVGCKDVAGVPSPPEVGDQKKLIDLGSNLDANSSGFNSITCNDKPCSVGTSTSTVDYYSFSIPYLPPSSGAPSGDLGLRQFSTDATYGANSYLKVISRKVKAL